MDHKSEFPTGYTNPPTPFSKEGDDVNEEIPTIYSHAMLSQAQSIPDLNLQRLVAANKNLYSSPVLTPTTITSPNTRALSPDNEVDPPEISTNSSPSKKDLPLSLTPFQMGTPLNSRSPSMFPFPQYSTQDFVSGVPDSTLTTSAPPTPASYNANRSSLEGENGAIALLPANGQQDAKYIDITEYLSLPQSQAAKKLSVPTSTLSKRWKEAVRHRKWPYRAVCKLDKEIMTILYNIPEGSDADLAPDLKAKLGRLLRERQELLKPVIIRL
eukprot:TRINITY_DN636_c2_g1_i1.p1 TRINITY_DN636_c2_g1~~TRINITY_DN636_c2_g1_i1.p1  ORF type:complete len:270 (+),score=31.92 TRINITY_DN636_c2_g1_i1:733-1542(+)